MSANAPERRPEIAACAALFPAPLPGLPVFFAIYEPRICGAFPSFLASLPLHTAVIFRAYGLKNRYRRALSAARAASAAGVPVFFAVKTDADAAFFRRCCSSFAGAHCAASFTGVAAVAAFLCRRARAGRVTFAAHNASELRAGQAAGADAALLSPLFPTRTHPNARCLGKEAFAGLAAAAGLPVYALGGAETPEKLRIAAYAGAAGVAAIRLFALPPSGKKRVF